MGHRSRYWCFTENTEPDALAYTLQAEDLPEGVTYICGQIERAEHTHLQGYVELSAHQRVSFLKKALSPTAHFEIRRGTQEEAIEYTRKLDDTTVLGTWFELGEPTSDKPGKRNDLLDVKALLDEGASDREVADAHFGSWIRYHKCFTEYRKLIAEPRNSDNPVEVIIYYGPSGTNKSRTARETNVGAYIKPVGNSWFDGYVAQKTIIFDEYRGNWLPYGTLLSICDRHSCTAPIKGGHVEIVATKLVFTSNKHPRHWYKDEYWDAFARRITEFWIHDGEQDPYQDPHPYVTILPHDLPPLPRNNLLGYNWN